jgi:hypothetical protein
MSALWATTSSRGPLTATVAMLHHRIHRPPRGARSSGGLKYLDFGTAPDESVAFDVEIDPRSGGSIELRLDDPVGSAVTTVTIAAAAAGKGWAHFTAPAPGITGVHPLYLAFHPDRGELGDVAFLGFTREQPQTA